MSMYTVLTMLAVSQVSMFTVSQMVFGMVNHPTVNAMRDITALPTMTTRYVKV